MTKKTWIVMAVVLLMVAFVAGCGDDDDNNPVTNAAPPLWIDGSFCLTPSMQGTAMIYANGGALVTIDSARIGDSLCSVVAIDNFPFSDYTWSFVMAEDGTPSTYQYVSGDVADIRLWGDGKSSQCLLTMLHFANDESPFTLPNNDTVILVGDTLTVFWATSTNAEWYAIFLDGRMDSSGTKIYIRDYYWTYDTSMFLADTAYPHRVDYMNVSVVPTTGPSPVSTSGNITGSLAEGKLYSYAGLSHIRITYMLPVLLTQSSQVEVPERTEMTAGQIVEAVYNAYK